MGCHGAINGLRAASALAEANPQATVLLCAVELCSLHYAFRWDPDRLVGNALFSDGAAALVGKASPPGESDVHSNGASTRQDGLPAPTNRWPSCRVLATGSCLIPDSLDAMSWRIGDYGFEMVLSSEVPTAIAENLRPWLVPWLAEHGISLDEVGSWAIHPGGPKIVEAVAETLELPPSSVDTSIGVLREHGNMSSPTVLFILNELRKQRAQLPCVALAFGPGLMAEGAILGE